MKIAWFKVEISPEIGARLAGYGPDDVSVMKMDDLFATGLCADDGENRVLLISLDLIGLDGWFIRDIRKSCSAILNTPESAVMLSCTHTHEGPQTRSHASRPEELHRTYLAALKEKLLAATRGLTDFRECEVSFFSCQRDENRNRRYVSGDNHATFTPHRREVLPMADGFADKELGLLMFYDPEKRLPLYLIGNYAAHPLAAHCPGLGGLRISADYPGAFRNYVESNTGAACMFVSGAAGDMIPREDELGDEASRSMGIRLGKSAMFGMMEARRNPLRYLMPSAKVGSAIRKFTVPLRTKYCNNPKRLPEEYLGRDDAELEIQLLSFGDVCFAGVPGELCAELGQEIKWHSPFRRTFIAYNATAYFSYMGPANFLVAGGYEASSQRFTARGGLKLVQAASDAMFELRESLYPSEGEAYPDNCSDSLVNILPNR